MSRATVINSLLFLLLSTVACGQKKNNIARAQKMPQVTTTAEWTILIFMNADNNLEDYAIANFLDMAKVGSSDKVNIIVQFDRHGGYDHSYQDWSQTLRFRITKGMKPEPDQKVSDLGEVDMGKGESIADFIDWGIKNYPAKKYMLNIWDHGQGYRLMQMLATLNKQPSVETESVKAQETATITAKAKKVITIQSNRSSDGSPVKSCSHDETNSSELYNREIQDAIEPIVKRHKKKFDVLGFDCCLMAMVETAFAFRNSADYMVASEELEPGDGWKYDDWLSKLLLNPSMEGSQLSKLLVNSYRKQYQFSERTTTLSAVDLSKMDAVASAISEFADEMSKTIKPNLSAIKKSRANCNHYAPKHTRPSPFYHIDFLRFCDQLISKSSNSVLKQKAESAKKMVKSVVLENYAGELRRGGKFGSYGLAIYFPPSGTDYKEDARSQGGYDKNNTLFPVEFVATHKWADFLHEYFKVNK